MVGNEFGHRVLDSALIVLRVARSLDSRLQNNADIDDFYRCLESVERVGFTTKSFDNKTVVVIEGLEGSGKSSVADKLSKMATNSVVLSRNSIHCVRRVQSIFNSMPGPVTAAFECVINYFIAYQIVTNNEYQLFIVEKYQHARCVSNVCERVPTVEEVNTLEASAFEWPFDLPVPQLVVFLAVPTDVRLHRLEADARPAKNASAAVVMDVKENTVYSKICGPTTVGIDASAELEDVCNVVFDAFEYYGITVSRVAPVRLSDMTQQQQQASQQQPPLSHRYSVLPSAYGGFSGDASKDLSSSGLSTSSGASVENTGAAAMTAEMYANRRISMGVYGVFTRLD